MVVPIVVRRVALGVISRRKRGRLVPIYRIVCEETLHAHGDLLNAVPAASGLSELAQIRPNFLPPGMSAWTGLYQGKPTKLLGSNKLLSIVLIWHYRGASSCLISL